MELPCLLCFLLSHPFLFSWVPLPIFNRLVFWVFCCEAFRMAFSCATPVDMLVIGCCYVARSEISVTLILGHLPILFWLLELQVWRNLEVLCQDIVWQAVHGLIASTQKQVALD